MLYYDATESSQIFLWVILWRLEAHVRETFLCGAHHLDLIISSKRSLARCTTENELALSAAITYFGVHRTALELQRLHSAMMHIARC